MNDLIYPCPFCSGEAAWKEDNYHGTMATGMEAPYLLLGCPSCDIWLPKEATEVWKRGKGYTPCREEAEKTLRSQWNKRGNQQDAATISHLRSRVGKLSDNIAELSKELHRERERCHREHSPHIARFIDMERSSFSPHEVVHDSTVVRPWTTWICFTGIFPEEVRAVLDGRTLAEIYARLEGKSLEETALEIGMDILKLGVQVTVANSVMMPHTHRYGNARSWLLSSAEWRTSMPCLGLARGLVEFISPERLEEIHNQPKG